MDVLSELKLISDISNIKTDNKAVGSGKIKNASKRKNVKWTQSSTLENWLTKDVSQKSLGQMRKSHKKFCGISSDDPNRRFNQSHKSSRTRSGEYNNISTDADSINRDEKKQKSSPRGRMTPNKKDSVNKSGLKTKNIHSSKILNFKKVTDKNCHKLSALQEMSNLTDTEVTAREKKARKKFRKILTSPLSLTSVGAELNAKSQTNILSLESNGRGSNHRDFRNNGTKKKSNEKNHQNNCQFLSNSMKRDNISIGKIQQAEGDGVTVTPTKHMKSPENLRRSPRNNKSPKSTAAMSVMKKLFNSNCSAENEASTVESKCYKDCSKSYKSIKTVISPKNKIDEKIDVHISVVNKDTVQTERNSVTVTPTKHMKSPENLRRSPRNNKSPKSTAATSVVKKLLNSDCSAENEASTMESKCYKYCSKSYKSIKTVISPKNKIAEKIDVHISVVNKSTLQTERNSVTVKPTKQKNSPENLRRSPRDKKSPKSIPATSVAKKLFDSDSTADSVIARSVLKCDESISTFKKVDVTVTAIKQQKDPVNLSLSSVNIKSSKSTRSIKSNKLTKYCEMNMPTTSNNTKTKETKQDVTPTKSVSAKSLRASARATSTAKQLPSSFIQNNNKHTCLTKDSLRNKDIKQTDRSPKQCAQSVESNRNRTHKTSKKYKKLDVKVNSNVSGEVVNETMIKTEAKKRAVEHTLDRFLSKTSEQSNKRKLSRSDSNEGSEFPSFRSNTKKLKTNKTKMSESFKKYGVTLPSVEEILKEQEDFLLYKNQVESFGEIDDKIFELPFSVKDLKNDRVVEENVLGCKHLSMHDIEKAFHKNFDYISAIFHGEKYSERHERFFEANVRSYEFTTKDLCYNTSTIVFSFEQREHLLMLLKKELDPEDKWTSYFFKVLLPELCLKIFMDTHSMEYNQAVKYLDTRPILDD